MRTLAPRERRLGAVAILVGVLALGWLAIIRPIVDGFASRAAQREALMLTYARDERTIGQLGSIGRAAARQQQTSGLYHMPAADIAAANAALAERLGSAVTAAGGELRGVEDMAAPSGIARARLTCRLTGRQLAVLLERLENAPPFLTVDAVGIGANEDQAEARPDLLDVRLELSASYSSTQPR